MPSRPSKPRARKAASAGRAAPATASAKKAKATPAKQTAKATDKTTPKHTKKAAKTAVKPEATKTTKTTDTATKAAAPAKKGAAAGTVAKRPGGAAGKAPVLDKFLQEQVALLEEERKVYLEQAEALKAEADQLAQEMEPGDIQFDEESGEGGTMNIDRERDLALSAQARAAVEEIDHALAKVRTGTYGVCESCGQPILKARLKALPYARLCVACKSGGLSRR